MALLMLMLLGASCTGSLWGHVHRLPLYQHAPEPLIPKETFRPVPYKSPLPHGLAGLLLPPAQQRPRGAQPSPPGPVDVWCGLRQVSVRVDRLRLRHWSSPGLFRLSHCGVSAASPRYLYFHRGLGECGGTAQVVGGQLVYTYSLTYTAPRRGFVLRAPPLNMRLSCHYNRFHYSYRVGFQPQAPPSLFLKSVRSQTSFSLSVCNSQWEVLLPEHSFLLGEPVYFVAQTGALRAGERLYVDSCHVTSSTDTGSSARLDIITNFGCMVDSGRADSSSHFHSRVSGELRFSVDSLLFSSEPQMLFLHCSMSVGLQPSPSSKSCTYDKATGRWLELELELELEASSSVCSCCEGVCLDPSGADSTSVSSTAWNMAQPPDQLHQDGSLKRGEPGLKEDLLHHDGSLKRGEPGLKEEILHHDGSLKRGEPGLKEDLLHHDGSLKRGEPGLKEEILHHDGSLKRGEPGLKEDLLHQDGSLKRGEPGLKEDLLHHDGSLKRGEPGLKEEILHHDGSLKRGEPGLKEDLLHHDGSLKRGEPGLKEEILHQDGSLKRGEPGLKEDLLHHDGSLKRGEPGLKEEILHHDGSLKRGEPGLKEDLLHHDGSLKRGEPGLKEEILHHDDVFLKRGEPGLTQEILHRQGSLTREDLGLTEEKLHHDDVSLKRTRPGLSVELLQGQGSLRREPDLTEELLHHDDVFLSLKRGELDRTEEFLQGQASLTRGGTGLKEELLQDDLSLKRGDLGLTEEQLHHDDVSLKRGEPDPSVDLLQGQGSPRGGGPDLPEEPLQDDVSLKRGDLGLTEEQLHHDDVSLTRGEPDPSVDLLQGQGSPRGGGPDLTEEPLQDDVSLTREGPGEGLGPGLTEELLQDDVSLTTGDLDQTNELNTDDHWAQSRGDTPGNDGPPETPPPHSSSLSKTPLTNQTSAQNQNTPPPQD